jgi:hypothetical protein
MGVRFKGIFSQSGREFKLQFAWMFGLKEFLIKAEANLDRVCRDVRFKGIF